MRVFAPTEAGAEFRDRNALRISDAERNVAQGGGVNLLAEYTVPLGRRALLWFTHAAAVVTTALAAGQTYDLVIQVTRPGPVTDHLAFTRIQAAAAVGTRDKVFFGPIEMATGDTVNVQGNLAAGAGVAAAAVGLNGVEYDP